MATGGSDRWNAASAFDGPGNQDLWLTRRGEDDALSGDTGDDVLFGGTGDDALDGGEGASGAPADAPEAPDPDSLQKLIEDIEDAYNRGLGDLSDDERATLARRIAQALEPVAGMLPVVGNILSAKDAIEAFTAAFQAMQKGDTGAAIRHAAEGAAHLVLAVTPAGTIVKVGKTAIKGAGNLVKLFARAMKGRRAAGRAAGDIKALEPPKVRDAPDLPAQAFEPVETLKGSNLGEIGSVTSNSNRAIMQGSDSVDDLLAAAKRMQPALESRLQEIAGEIPGARFGSTRVKDLKGTLEKIAQGRPPATLPDYLGGRFFVDSPAAVRGVLARLQKKFPRLLKVDDRLSTNRPGYRGVHVQTELGNGMSVEIQIIPRELEEADKITHPIYDKIKRIDEETASLEQLAEVEAYRLQIRQIYDEAWAKAGPAWQDMGGAFVDSAGASLSQ